jgi:hypothetical protein
MITEADLAPLPEPVQRYLRYSQVLNKPKVRCAKVYQKGFLRLSPQQKWLPVEAVQYTTLVGRYSRKWYATCRMGPLTVIRGYDRYDNGVGQMLIRLLSLFTVADFHGPEVNMSAAIIFINDMVMWPTAFLSDSIRWEPVDANSACAHVTLFDQQFSAMIYFNEIGELVDFVTEDRYRAVGKDLERNHWSTPFASYRTANGLRIPSQGSAIWHLPEGEFLYIRVVIGEIQYDQFDFD